jgi:hypothetical protein
MRDIDEIVRANSAFKSLEAMTDTHPNYRPSVDVSEEDKLAMANAYDEMMIERGDERRAFRYGTPFRKTYAAIAKEFRELAKVKMAECKAGNRIYHYKHRGCEIIMLDALGCRHDGYDPDYLDMGEVSGKRVREIVGHFLAEEERSSTTAWSRADDPICGFSLDGGIDVYDNFADAMRYPDDYEPWYDSYEVGATLTEII